MSIVSTDKAGRVIIPVEVRKKLGITANTRLFLIDIGDKIVIEKLERLEIAKRLQEELKNVDIDKEIIKVVTHVIKTYELKDFSAVGINNLLTQNRVTLSRQAILSRPIE